MEGFDYHLLHFLRSQIARLKDDFHLSHNDASSLRPRTVCTTCKALTPTTTSTLTPTKHITLDSHGRLQLQHPASRTENQDLRVRPHIRPSELQTSWFKSLLARMLTGQAIGLDSRMQADACGVPAPTIHLEQARRRDNTFSRRTEGLANLSAIQTRRRSRTKHREHPAGSHFRINKVEPRFDSMDFIDAEVRQPGQSLLPPTLGSRQTVLRKTTVYHWDT